MLNYAEFFYRPLQSWITLNNVDKFQLDGGLSKVNKTWRPFRYIAEGVEADKKKYRPSPKSIQAKFSAITGFYTHLMDNELVLGNPAMLAKKDYMKNDVVDKSVKETKRLDQDQWKFLLDTAQRMADEDPLMKRNLFLIASMKSLFLRISELSERDEWTPIMSHFWQGDSKKWWLKIFW